MISSQHSARRLLLGLVMAGSLGVSVLAVLGQAVAVTLRVDTNVIARGGTTTLHVDARIIPSLRSSSDRIFSWYVDVLNTNGAVAMANYAGLQKSASDRDPATSSTGVADESHRRGIYDTFLNRPGAGRDAAIELMSIPITGLVAGRTRFRVQAGTGEPTLTSDFYVAPSAGGDPYVGGDYANAFADLEVTSEFAPLRLFIEETRLGNGSARVTIRYAVKPGTNYFIESRPSWGIGSNWQTVPGGPFNSGIYIETNSLVSRFYRARLQP